MKKCHECGGELREDTELIENEPIHVLKCVKCGRYTVSINEYERIRKKLHPTLLERMKSILGLDNQSNLGFKGKVL